MDSGMNGQALTLGQLEVPRQYAESIQRLGVMMRLKKNEVLYTAGDAHPGALHGGHPPPHPELQGQ